MTARSNLQVATFQYRTDPFPYTQAEGTHWYHPHKHGSVALQVANGMPGEPLPLPTSTTSSGNDSPISGRARKASSTSSRMIAA